MLELFLRGEEEEIVRFGVHRSARYPAAHIGRPDRFWFCVECPALVPMLPEHVEHVTELGVNPPWDYVVT
jgi:hypothetical protein